VLAYNLTHPFTKNGDVVRGIERTDRKNLHRSATIPIAEKSGADSRRIAGLAWLSHDPEYLTRKTYPLVFVCVHLCRVTFNSASIRFRPQE
jgi:hypothetical protein